MSNAYLEKLRTIGAIVRVGGGSKERYAIIRTKSQAARASVSRLHRQEYDNEKRMLELNAKMPASSDEYNAPAIAKMMCTDEHKVRAVLRKKKKTKVVLDGKID